MRTPSRLVVLALAAALCAGAAAQPPKDPPSDRPAPPEDRQPEDREAYKARLERTLADNKRRQERLEAAIKKLAEGAPVDEVRRETEGARPPPGSRDQRSGRFGPGQGPRGPGDERRGPDQAPPEERLTREEVIAIIETFNPEVAGRFREALKDNAGFGGRIIDRVEPMVREIKAERDPEMRQLRVDNFTNGFELVGATRAFAEANRTEPGSEATREKATKLRQLLGAHFDLMTKMHQQEIVMLERRIKQLRDDLASQVEGRDSFIEKRMEDVKRFKGRGEREPRPSSDPKSAGEPKR